jgi:hypothetical protein
MKKLDRRSFKVVPGRFYDTPKEIWGFRSDAGEGRAESVARAFLEANRETLGIDLEPLFRKAPRILRGLGAEHVIFQQRWKRRRVHRAYVTVHVGLRDRRVYLVKSRAAPKDVLKQAPGERVPEARAARAALARVRGRSQTRLVGAPELLWFPARRLLHPAWRVRVRRAKPRAEFIVYVNAETGAVIQVYDNLAALAGRGRVFAPNPMARDRTFTPLDEDREVQRPRPAAYLEVALAALKGNGFLDGARATTRLTRQRLRRPDHDFRVDAHRRGFEEVSAYYHVDRAIAYLEEMGYTGPRRIFPRPLEIDARGTPEDNSWYSPGERTLTFGLGNVDDAEDGETVLHEFGHALQDAICPDFGQSPEAAAMGEGFGDYWAGSFFEAKKPAPYRPTVMSWDGVLDPGEPPCVRRLDSPHTYETFDHSARADEHENGEIWAATLWEVRGALGRKRADRVIVDSHFQLDGFTTFARGARAILDADRNLHHGAHETTLKRIFRRRGIGPVE